MTATTSHPVRTLPLAAALLAGLAAMLLLSGCAIISPVEPEEKRYYALEPLRPDDAPARTANAGVLVVRRFPVSPGFSDRSLVYRTADGRYVQDPYNRFLVPPADMITQAMQSWLRNAGLFDHTVNASSRLRPDYVLEGTVPTLYADFASGESRLELSCFLLRDDSLSYDVLLQQEYTATTPMKTKDAKGAVAAMERSLADILTRLEADIAALDIDTTP